MTQTLAQYRQHRIAVIRLPFIILRQLIVLRLYVNKGYVL